MERFTNRMSKDLRNRLMRAPVPLDLAEGGRLFLEDLAEKCIQLGGGEGNLWLVCTGNVPVLMR